MNFQEIADNIKAQAAKTSPLGGTFKLELDDNIVFIDGTGSENIVSFEDKEADTVIATSIQAMTDMINGELNPMMATMTGKVKIKGNMGLAMKLQSFL
ncbi:MAG: SCP2 sterol-binding domain-containing protein [Deltaproteobacteria bacterium]